MSGGLLTGWTMSRTAGPPPIDDIGAAAVVVRRQGLRERSHRHGGMPQYGPTAAIKRIAIGS